MNEGLQHVQPNPATVSENRVWRPSQTRESLAAIDADPRVEGRSRRNFLENASCRMAK